MVGRSVGRRGVRRQRALSDGRRRTDGSFYFFLEPPIQTCPKQDLNLGFHVSVFLNLTLAFNRSATLAGFL